MSVKVDYLAIKIFLIDLFILIYILVGLYVYRVQLIIFLQKNIRWIFLGIFLYVFNIYFSLNVQFSIYIFVRVLIYILFFYNVIKQKYNRKTLFNIFLFSTFLEIMLVILQLVRGQSQQGPWYFTGERLFSINTPNISLVAPFGHEMLRAYGSFSHPNSLGGFYLCLFILICELRFNLKIKPLIPVLKMLIIVLILLSFSKVAIAVLCIYILVKHNLKINTLILTLICLIFVLQNITKLSLFERFDSLSSLKNIDLKTLILGTGLGNSIKGGFVTVINNTAITQPLHNIFLLFIIENGILLTVYYLYVINIIKKQWSKKQITYIMCACVLGLFDHYIVTLHQNIYIVIIGLAFLYENKKLR